MPMSGVISPDTIALMIAVNARPMTTATARSTTLPRVMNSLNSLKTSVTARPPEGWVAATSAPYRTEPPTAREGISEGRYHGRRRADRIRTGPLTAGRRPPGAAPRPPGSERRPDRGRDSLEPGGGHDRGGCPRGDRRRRAPRRRRDRRPTLVAGAQARDPRQPGTGHRPAGSHVGRAVPTAGRVRLRLGRRLLRRPG